MADSESTQSKSTKRSAAAQTDDAQDKKAPPRPPGDDEGNGEDGPAADDTPSIPVSQLIAEGSGLLGYPSHVVAGGLSGHDDADEELAIDDAKAEVEAWLQQPVQLDPREGEE